MTAWSSSDAMGKKPGYEGYTTPGYYRMARTPGSFITAISPMP